MARSRSSSVANLKAMFENTNAKSKPANKPSQKISAKRHSSCDFWENAFQIHQPELMKGPDKVHKEWEHEEKAYQSQQSNPGKIGPWNPQNKWTPNQREVGKLSLSNQVSDSNYVPSPL